MKNGKNPIPVFPLNILTVMISQGKIPSAAKGALIRWTFFTAIVIEWTGNRETG